MCVHIRELLPLQKAQAVIPTAWLRNCEGNSMSRRGQKQIHLFLSDLDLAVLVDMEDRFGLNRSEIIRRLVRAAHGHGPMLTADDSQKVVLLSHQLRKAGANLFHLLCALRDGYAVSDEGAFEVWQGLHQRISKLDQELSRMTESHGLKLRRSAKLEDRQPQLEATEGVGSSTKSQSTTLTK